MRYWTILVGLVPILIGIVIGLFIPLGGGSAAILGGVLGAILGYQLAYGQLGRTLQRRFSASNGEQEQPASNDPVTQRVIAEQNQQIREIHVADDARFKDIFRS